MSLKWEDLTYYPLKWIWFGGLHPQWRSWIANVQFWFNFSAFVLVLALAGIEIFDSINKNNVFYTIESLLTIFLYLHIIGKYTVLHFNRQNLFILLEARSKFWQVDDFDKKTKTECQDMMKKALILIKCYLTYSSMVASSFLIQPFITGELPVLLYVPEGWYFFLAAGFWYLTPSIVASIWGVDTMFYSISTPVIVQLKLLASRFENLDMVLTSTKSWKKFKENLKTLVDYHNFLIWYSQKINRLFNGIFLTQFLVAIAIACTQLFIASQKQFGFANKMKCLMYFLMQIVETGIYCFTTEAISENCANIGNAIYKSLWYQMPINSVRKDIVTVISRSQKRIVFSGYRLVRINMQTFTQIFKTALSFYTYLNTMVYND